MFGRRYWRYVFLVVCAASVGVSSSQGQKLTQFNPLHISFRAIAVSPNYDEAYAGDSSMFMMVRNGAWTPMYYFDKSITLYAAAFTDAKHLAVAGTGGKVFCSSTDGSTWSVTLIGTKATIRALAPDGLGNLFAVGDSGLIMKSTNNGAAWMRITSPITKQLNAIGFGSSGRYAVAVGNDSAIVQTTDGGATWSVVPLPYDLRPFGNEIQRVDFTALAMAPTNDSVWIGMERPVMPMLMIHGKPDPNAKLTLFPGSGPLTSMVYVGENGLSRWHIAAFAADDYLYGDTSVTGWDRGAVGNNADADGNPYASVLRYRAAAIESNDIDTFIVVAGDEVQISRALLSDGFLNFYDQIPAGHAFQANFYAVSILSDGYGFGTGMGGRIYETNDSGRSWYHRSNSFFGSPLIGVAAIDDFTSVSCGWGGLLVRTEDGGNTFDTLPSGTQEKLHSVAFPSRDSGIIVGDYGYIIRSTDQGLTWNPISTSTTQFLYSVAFATPDIGLVTGASGTILRTTDRGETWTEINNPFSGTEAAIKQVQAFSSGVCYARTQLSLLRSKDFGQSWVVVPGPVDSIGMEWFNVNVGITGEHTSASKSVPDSVTVHVTTNGGAQWIPVTVPIWNYNKVVFHWLNDHQVLLYGADGFVVELEIEASGAVVTHSASSFVSDASLYPNPSAGNYTVTYASEHSGPVTITLWSEDGKMTQSLFTGEEPAGRHEHAFATNTLPGTYFLKINTTESTTTIPILIER